MITPEPLCNSPSSLFSLGTQLLPTPLIRSSAVPRLSVQVDSHMGIQCYLSVHQHQNQPLDHAHAIWSHSLTLQQASTNVRPQCYTNSLKITTLPSRLTSFPQSSSARWKVMWGCNPILQWADIFSHIPATMQDAYTSLQHDTLALNVHKEQLHLPASPQQSVPSQKKNLCSPCGRATEHSAIDQRGACCWALQNSSCIRKPFSKIGKCN